MVRDNSKILKNSFYVYGRMLFTMFITLYTSRLVLEELGIENYGTYNIVAGITIMFASIKSLFASAMQRFYNFEIGQGNNIGRINLVFNIGMRIHLIGAILLFIILEFIGIWLITNKLDIPNDNYFYAHYIFQFTIIATILTMISVPFDAMIIARERMGFYAMISIIDALLKFFIAISLSFFSEDKLLVYGILIFGVSVINFILLIKYTTKNFKEECKFSKQKDILLTKHIMRFAAWNFFGNVSYSLTNEVSNLFLNIFGGVTANAARGLTYQIKGAITSLLSNALVAVRPQATQEYAVGNISSFFKIVYFATKAIYYISLLVIIPLFIFTEYILNIWLGDIPTYCVIFTRIMLIQVLIRSFHEPIDLIFKSTGNLRYYQLISFVISIIGLPIIYYLLKIGLDVYFVFIGMCVMEFFEFIFIVLLSQKEGLSLKQYITSSLIPIFIVTILTVITCFVIYNYLQLNIFMLFFITMFVVVSIIFYCGFSSKERVMMLNAFKMMRK